MNGTVLGAGSLLAALGAWAFAGLRELHQSPVPVSQADYVPIVKRDWSAFESDSALKAAGLFLVEGGARLASVPPAVQATDLYQLVSDPVFGKVVRARGDPAVNTSVAIGQGPTPAWPRVATHFVKLVPPRGSGPYSHLWVRQFVRFSQNWVPSGRGGSGGGGYKLMFFRWLDAPGRMQYEITSNDWYNWSAQGYRGKVNRLVYRTPAPMWEPVKGARRFTVGPIIARSFIPPGRRYSPPVPGDGQWYEFVMGFERLGPKLFRSTWAWRRYTTSGTVAPDKWTAEVVETDHGLNGPDIAPVRSYEMGINRNRSFDSVMWWDWGPYELVDGSKYPNPFRVPMQR